MPTSVSQFLDHLDEMIAERSLLLHPFYQAWTRGELPLETLRDYAQQYYRHVDAFPRYLSAVHANTEDRQTRRHILSNLVDEEAGNPNHPELWLQFAGGLGLSEGDVRNAEPRNETNGLVNTFQSICRDRSTAEGLAALYAYESQIPAVAESKISGLQRFYGIDSPEGLAYFQVHIEADREHAAVERKLLAEYITDESAEAISKSTSEALAALWEMLSGVCRHNAISC